MINDSEVNSAIQALLFTNDLEGRKPSPCLTARIKREWAIFKAAAIAMGFDAVEHRVGYINRHEGDEWDYAAHDWILTRNGEGCGFWDGGWDEEMGKKLTELSKTFGQLDVYVYRKYVYPYGLVYINKLATYCYIKYKESNSKNHTDYMIKLPEIDNSWRRIRCNSDDYIVLKNGGIRYCDDYIILKNEEISLGNILNNIYVPTGWRSVKVEF
jgi:hypothetical protein